MRGKIEVELEGAFPERFLNMCAQNGVAFWGVAKVDETRVRVTMLPQGLKKFSRDAQLAGCSVKVLSKRGVPFFLYALRGRVALWGGLALFLLIIFVTNQYVWEFEVEGNHIIADGVILEALEDIGVRVGTYTNSINMTDIKNKMILRLDALSWIGVNVKGGKAVITVRERVPLPYMVNKEIPCNIVAAKDGLVVRMDTFSGAAQVQPGQTVQKGQTLVSGVVDTLNLGARFIHAQAHVQARTWRDITAVTPAEVTGKEYTGRTYSRNAIVFMGNRINLYSGGSVNYEYYDKISTQSVLKLPGGMLFPVSLVTEVFSEYKPKQIAISEDEGNAMLRSGLEETLYDSLHKGEVSKMDVAYEKRGGLLGARVTAECLEDIAVTVELPR